MHNHQYTYSPKPQESTVKSVAITVACLAVFALWGVLLALGI